MSIKIDMGRSKPVLHVYDVETNFSSAIFLNGESTEAVWDAFMKYWASLYAGFKYVFRVDAASSFTSELFQHLSASHGIELQYSGVESQKSIGAGETLHSSLRRVYKRIISENPTIDPELALHLSVKASNDTANVNGLVPSLLVFGVLPRFPMTPTDLPDQGLRMAALQVKRVGYGIGV
jgi:hypothetical protein